MEVGKEGSMADISSSTWETTVASLAERGLELSDILALHVCLLEKMAFFVPANSTTKDVVFEAIIPMTKERLCSYATLVNDGRPKRAQRFVSHVWSNAFGHTLAAVVADALEVPIFEKIAHKLMTAEGTMAVLDKVHKAGRAGDVYWLCCFSINQHKSICHRAGSNGSHAHYPACGCSLEKCTTGEASEMNKFADMMANLHSDLGLTQVVAVDRDFRLFSRAWCVAELVEAQRQGMPQKLVLYNTASIESRREQLERLTVRECEATNPQDMATIMAGIEDIDAFDLHLRELLLNKNTGLLSGWQKAIHGYLFRWDEFSPGYVKRLSEASHGSRWRILALALGPVAIVVPQWAFLPYPEPGSAHEAEYVIFGHFSLIFLTCYVGLVVLVAALAQLQWRQLDKVIVTSATLANIVVQCGCVTLWHHLLGDVWPVPWCASLLAPSVTMIAGCLWWAIPRDLRRDPACRRRCGMAIVAMAFILTLWVITGPLICAVMSLSDHFWIHSLLAAALLGQKLLCERAVTVVMKSLTADVLPIFIFACSSCYELLLCTVLSRVQQSGESSWQNWCLFVELIGFDVIENCFHLWTLARQGDTALGSQSKKPQKVDQGSDLNGTLSQISEGRDQLILSQLILREFCELAAPVKFLIILFGLYHGHREQSDLVCRWDDSNFVAVCRMVVLDLAVELVVAGATLRVLQRQGKSPLHTLVGLIKQHFWCFLTWDLFNLCARLTEQARFGGADYTFQFKWMKEEGATWLCGLQWLDN